MYANRITGYWERDMGQFPERDEVRRGQADRGPWAMLGFVGAFMHALIHQIAWQRAAYDREMDQLFNPEHYGLETPDSDCGSR